MALRTAFGLGVCVGRNTFGRMHSILGSQSIQTAIIKSPQAPTKVSVIRRFSLSSQNSARKIIVEESGDVTTISAKYVESPFAPQLLKTGKEKDHVCPLCALDLDLKHTDVLILSQFLRPDGCMLPQRITGLCNKQQKQVKYLVMMSQKAGLMPNLAPHWSKKDPQKRFGSKKFNRYFDESTLDD